LLPERPSTHAGDDTAALPVADGHKIRLASQRNDRILDAKHAQRLERVGAQIKTSADLAWFRRLLADDDFSAAAMERQRRSKPADTAADDGSAGRARHSKLPLRVVRTQQFCSAWHSGNIVRRTALSAVWMIKSGKTSPASRP